MSRVGNLFTLFSTNYSYRKQNADYGQICVLHVSTCVCLHVHTCVCLFVFTLELRHSNLITLFSVRPGKLRFFCSLCYDCPECLWKDLILQI